METASDSESERDWSGLPPELLSLILSQLSSVGDNCAFKSVCKSWNMIPYVMVPLPLHDPQFSTSPCLIIPKKDTPLTWKIFHSTYNNFYYLDFPELKDAEIRCSNFGWLLLSHGPDLFFFEPIRREKIVVPRWDESMTFASLCFSCPPNSKGRGCLIFGMLNTSDPSTEVGFVVIRLRGSKEYWYSGGEYCRVDTYSCEPEDCLPQSTTYPMVVLNEILYGLDKFGDVFVLDIGGSFCGFVEFAFTRYVDCHDINPKREFRKRDIMEVDGEIWGVLVDDHDQEVFVMKLDLESKDWMRLESLGDKCLYLGDNGSFVETASPESGLANKIFFDSFYGKNCVLYSMSTRSYHLVGCDLVIADSCSLVGMGSSTTWIKPKKPSILVETSTKSDWLDWILNYNFLFLMLFILHFQ